MNKELAIEYEVFEEEGEVVLSVVDKEKDEVLNMFKGKMAENIYRMLSGEERNKLSSADSKIVRIPLLLLFLLLTGSHNLLNYAIICLVDKQTAI